MANNTAPRDGNYKAVIQGVSSLDFISTTNIAVNPSTHAMLVEASISSTGSAIEDGVDSSIKATVFDYSNSNPLAVVLRDTNGDYVSVGGGTQYAVDSVAGATDVGNLALVVRDDALTTLTPADGDYTQLRTTSTGRLWGSVVVDTALPAGANVIGHVVTDTGSTTAVTGTVTISGAVTEATLDAAIVSQGTALGAIKNLMVAGSVTTNAPSYTTGQISPLSLTPAGGIRIDWKDSAANTTALNVSLAAETTKVIGVVRNSDGAGNLLTSNSTTYTAKFGLDSNLLGTKGTAFTTAGFVDIKGADGDVFVRQATGTNLHMVVDSGTITTVSTVTNVATIGTSVTPGTAAANLGKAEDVASAGGDTGVFTLGIRNDTLADTTNTTGDYSQMSTDLKGRLMVGSAPRTLKANQITTITTSTSETTIVTAVASTFLDLYGLILTNTSATAVNVAIKDDTGGTTRMNIAVPAGDTRGFMLPIDAAIKQSATNKNWTATSSGSITSLIITALTVANV